MFDYLFFKGKQSLKAEVYTFARKNFRESFPRKYKSSWHQIKQKLCSKNSWPYIVVFVFLFIAAGQLFHPKDLQVINMPTETANGFIDQRVSNIVAIFSITMVVIGWLISQLSIKEAMSYQILFSETYLYPIFYFILTLIGCMMMCSLLRHESWFSIGDAVISGMYLIVIALIAVGVLFTRLIKAIGTAFFFQSLEKEVMKEMYRVSKPVILSRKSQLTYFNHCKGMGLVDGIRFGTDLSDFAKVRVNQGKEPKPSKEDSEELFFAFGGRNTHQIADVKLGILSHEFKKLALKDENYFKPLGLGTTLPVNYIPFYFSPATGKVNEIQKGLNAAFVFKKARKNKAIETPYLDELHKRFEKDIAEGKNEQVKMGLNIFKKVFQLERQITKNC